MAALLERLDEIVLPLRKDAGENRKLLGTYIRGNGPGWTDLSVQTDGMGDDGSRRRGVTCHHDRAHSERVQFHNQSGGIRPGRIAESYDSGKLQRRWRTNGDGQNA